MPSPAAPVGIIGAGCMGRGIAEVAVTHGYPVRLLDIDAATARTGVQVIHQRFQRLLESQRITAEQYARYLEAVLPADGPSELRDCSFIIEAVPERLTVKAEVLSQVIPAISPETVIATNTSCLSVTELAQAINEPARTIGLHFFNPAPIQSLVELITTADTDSGIAQCAEAIAGQWGKMVVHSSDSPGFIVNRVARPYYLEAWRILEEGLAGVDQIDHVMRTIAGFPMGPFQLMDYLGHDLSLEVTSTIYRRMKQPERLKPSDLQRQLVTSGRLGRRTGRGAYEYASQNPMPAIFIDAKSLTLPNDAIQLLDRFAGRALKNPPDAILEQYIFARILVCIINEACHALDDEVATVEDVDTAMRLGTRYPLGPFDWMRRIEPPLCVAWLRELNRHTHADRYAPAPFLLKLSRE